MEETLNQRQQDGVFTISELLIVHTQNIVFCIVIDNAVRRPYVRAVTDSFLYID